MGENTVAPLEAALYVEHDVIKRKSRDQCYSNVESLARVQIILMGSRHTNVYYYQSVYYTNTLKTINYLVKFCMLHCCLYHENTDTSVSDGCFV